MKKNVLLLSVLLTFAVHTVNAQCTGTFLYPSATVSINNDGLLHNIAACSYTGDYSNVSGLTVGDTYEFTIVDNASGAHKYITIQDGGTALAHGTSPLVWTATVTDIELHFSDDAACNFTSSCHTSTYTNTSQTPSCPDPTDLQATGITENSADLGWTQLNATNWDIEWGVSGFAQTGTPTIDNTTNNPQNITNLTASTDYDFYVRADCGMDNTSDVSAWVGPFTFTTNAPPPANDNFANAQVLNCNDNVTGSTEFATLDEGDAPDGFGATMDAQNVWFSYTGSGTPEEITIDMCPSSYDTSFLVYTGTSGNLTLVFGNDDNGAECTPNGDRSYGSFNSDGTSTYYIGVTGYAASSVGAFDLTLTCQAVCTPAQTNQDCGTAIPISVDNSTTTIDNSCASINAAQTSCDLFSSIADVWYSFVVPSSGEVDITTALGTATAAHLAVYSGTDCTALTQEYCSSATTASLSLTGLTAAETLYLQVWNNGSEEGTIDITLSDPSLNTLELENQEAFTYYPNPVSSILTFDAKKNIEAISIFNILGQEVLQEFPNETLTKVNMSTLEAGAYFVKVRINGITKTIKVLKS